MRNSHSCELWRFYVTPRSPTQLFKSQRSPQICLIANVKCHSQSVRQIVLSNSTFKGFGARRFCVTPRCSALILKLLTALQIVPMQDFD